MGQTIQALLEHLQNSRDTVRASAASKLGALGDERAAGPLGAVLLNDPSSKVRRIAAQALGKLGQGEALVSLVRGLLREGASSVQNAIESALTAVRDPKLVARVLLVVLLKDENPALQVVAAEVVALALENPTKLLPKLDGIAEGARTFVQALVADVRELLQPGSVAPPEDDNEEEDEEEALGDPDEVASGDVPNNELLDRLLGISASTYRKYSDEIFQALIRFVEKGGDFSDVKAVFRAMGDEIAVSVFRNVLDLTDDSENVRADAVRSLGELGDRRAVGHLGLSLLTDPLPRVRKLAAKALGQLRSNEVLDPLLRGLLAETSKDVRLAIEGALDYIEDPRSVVKTFLVVLMKEDSPYVHLGVQKTVDIFLADPATLKPKLASLLKHSTGTLKGLAADALDLVREPAEITRFLADLAKDGLQHAASDVLKQAEQLVKGFTEPSFQNIINPLATVVKLAALLTDMEELGLAAQGLALVATAPAAFIGPTLMSNPLTFALGLGLFLDALFEYFEAPDYTHRWTGVTKLGKDLGKKGTDAKHQYMMMLRLYAETKSIKWEPKAHREAYRWYRISEYTPAPDCLDGAALGRMRAAAKKQGAEAQNVLKTLERRCKVDHTTYKDNPFKVAKYTQRHSFSMEERELLWNLSGKVHTNLEWPPKEAPEELVRLTNKTEFHTRARELVDGPQPMWANDEEARLKLLSIKRQELAALQAIGRSSEQAWCISHGGYSPRGCGDHIRIRRQELEQQVLRLKNNRASVFVFRQTHAHARADELERHFSAIVHTPKAYRWRVFREERLALSGMIFAYKYKTQPQFRRSIDRAIKEMERQAKIAAQQTLAEELTEPEITDAELVALLDRAERFTKTPKP